MFFLKRRKIMPKFETIYNNVNFALDKSNLSSKELAAAIRFSIASEYEAIQIYEQIIDKTDDVFVKKVLADIVREEKVHVGELTRLLLEVDSDATDTLKEGFREASELKP